MKKWDELPIAMQNEKVRYYYDILQKHETELKIKRLFDVVCSFVMIVILSPILVLLSIMIKLDSKGPVLFKQVRVTTYGRKFKIWKFRTMVNHADKLGTQVTTKGDARITRMGHLLRKVRLDELPQLFNVLNDFCWNKTRGTKICGALYRRNDGYFFAPSRCYFANKY